MTPGTRSVQLTEAEAAELRAGNEKSLARCIEKPEHWETLFPDLTHLRSEPNLIRALGASRPDALAIDVEGRPVVLEYKKNTGGPICQSLDYIGLLKERPDVFTDLTDKPVDWSRPRLICIAKGFPGIEPKDLQHPDCSIELYVWNLSDQNLLVLTRQETPMAGDPGKERFGRLFGQLARQYGTEGLGYYGDHYWRLPVGIRHLFWISKVLKTKSLVYLEAGRLDETKDPTLNQKIYDFLDVPERKQRIKSRLKRTDLNIWWRARSKDNFTQLGCETTGGWGCDETEWLKLISSLLETQKDLAQAFDPEFRELDRFLAGQPGS